MVLNPNLKVNYESEITCPRCKSGRLVLKENSVDRTKFYGCSNFPYCNYHINDFIAVKRNKRCPWCGDILIVKKGRYGLFYRCNNTRCKYTEKYDKD